VSLFSFFSYIIYIYIYIYIYFFHFLKGERGHELFKNLLRGEGIRLISLFRKKKLLKDENERWVGCGVFFIML
jgi:hypothetical protein